MTVEARPRFTLIQRIVLAVVPPVVSALVWICGLTWRFEVIAEDGVIPVLYGQRPGPEIYCFWHQCVLPCTVYFRKSLSVILISRSFDGELVARTVERLGFVAIRGSSSRDGAAGLRNLQRAYLAGNYCAITADGPRGPAQVAKPGVIQLAKLVDTTIGAFYVHPHQAWQAKSWDRLLIPKPFSRVTVAWTAHVPAEQAAVQAALDHSVELAQSN